MWSLGLVRGGSQMPQEQRAAFPAHPSLPVFSLTATATAKYPSLELEAWPSEVQPEATGEASEKVL